MQRCTISRDNFPCTHIRFKQLDRMSCANVNFPLPNPTQNFASLIIDVSPYLWGIVNLAFWLISALAFTQLMNWLSVVNSEVLTVSMKLNTKVNKENLQAWFKTQTLLTDEAMTENKNVRRKVSFEINEAEKWKGLVPFVTITIDPVHGCEFIRSSSFRFCRSSHPSHLNYLIGPKDIFSAAVSINRESEANRVATLVGTSSKTYTCISRTTPSLSTSLPRA